MPSHSSRCSQNVLYSMVSVSRRSVLTLRSIQGPEVHEVGQLRPFDSLCLLGIGTGNNIIVEISSFFDSCRRLIDASV